MRDRPRWKGQRRGGGSSGGGSPLEEIFNKCKEKYGDQYWKEHLTFSEYLTASLAAQAAGIDVGIVLALWWNESKFNSDVNLRGAHGEVGPLQLRPNQAIADLRRLLRIANDPSDFGSRYSRLIQDALANYQTSLYANLLAGALYYSAMLNHYGFSADQAAAAYNGGPNNYRDPDAQKYQRDFNAQLEVWQKITDCMKSGGEK
jgi:soluble lytic murein transglycosylase-like protein